MCRIAGIIDGNSSKKQLLLEVKAMCDVMAHGGPDDEGFYSSERQSLCFGHRRLSLIDLSEDGHQPMAYHNGQLHISFNGEIYNHLELKKELSELGLDFISKSDTEVILAAYAAWGVESFSRLEGMFAFSLFDLQDNKTFLVRDRSGIKPLYYSLTQNRLTFASEVRAFKQTSFQFSQNPDWQIYFLAFGHLPEPFTTLREVRMLTKGNYLLWDHSANTAHLENYQQEAQVCKIVKMDAAINAIKKNLKRAVEQHLISDAPIGIFLSGGIDSSILSVEATQSHTTQRSVKTISINFSEREFSEEKYQHLIAEQINSEHAGYQISKATFLKLLPQAITAMDQPTSDGINSWFVNYFAKKRGLKAVLSGIGADELFGGYPSFKRMGVIRMLSRLPSILLKASSAIQKPIFQRAYYLSYENTIGEYLFLRGIFYPKEIANVLDVTVEHVNQVLKNIPVHCPKHIVGAEKASWLEGNLYMQNQLLKDTDTMSMAHGIEVRTPFLDQKLKALVDNLPVALKFKKAPPKSLLIDAFKNKLPEAIWNRPKMGFTFPFQEWLRSDFQFKNAKGNQQVSKILSSFKTGKTHWSKAMVLHILSTYQ